eukprot:TRINITY_DN29616_c0_g3_i1.p2 TRINITY_DN29616_c0_g3~~TRINITY_DN29616_c0_g3_i1.p2  ORF type:complete len:208 (+),score=25.37 TRINITY_DN29616_c0_g3_i1:362-985(+)
MQKRDSQQNWSKLFEGDTDGYRCIQQPYKLIQINKKEILFEISDLPFWIERGDIYVNIDDQILVVAVRGELFIQREFWKPGFVNVSLCDWNLEKEKDEIKRSSQKLSISLIFDYGDEQQNVKDWFQNIDRKSVLIGKGKKGVALFKDDNDFFGLEDLLQACCFAFDQKVFVRNKPWEQLKDILVLQESQLSDEVQQHLNNIRKYQNS